MIIYAIQMAVNYIDKIRTEIKNGFNPGTFSKGDTVTSVSPSRHFRLIATNYWSKESDLDLTKVELFSGLTHEKLFDFFTNDGQFFYSWLEKDNTEYFICAEDLFGGQTIVDLTNKKMAGYSSDTDGFIWTGFLLSPGGRILATIGCFWACPYMIKLFDFSDPLALPLKEISQISLIENNEVLAGWLDNETFATKGILKEYERAVNGDLTGKILSETPIERHLKINGTQEAVLYGGLTNPL